MLSLRFEAYMPAVTHQISYTFIPKEVTFFKVFFSKNRNFLTGISSDDNIRVCVGNFGIFLIEWWVARAKRTISGHFKAIWNLKIPIFEPYCSEISTPDPTPTSRILGLNFETSQICRIETSYDPVCKCVSKVYVEAWSHKNKEVVVTLGPSYIWAEDSNNLFLVMLHISQPQKGVIEKNSTSDLKLLQSSAQI